MIHIQTIYSILGRILCTVAGGAVGFVIGGPVIAMPGLVAGYIAGLLIDKGAVHLLKRT